MSRLRLRPLLIDVVCCGTQVALRVNANISKSFAISGIRRSLCYLASRLSKAVPNADSRVVFFVLYLLSSLRIRQHLSKMLSGSKRSWVTVIVLCVTTPLAWAFSLSVGTPTACDDLTISWTGEAFDTATLIFC
jgi:hypothetical protein